MTKPSLKWYTYNVISLQIKDEKGDKLPKFFVKKDQLAAGNVTIVGGDAVHLTKVLRLTAGDGIILCDGQGMDYEAEIAAVSKDGVSCSIVRSYPCDTEPKIQITLFQGVPKASKMEYIIQKCTELGIVQIVPVMTKRTVVKLEDAKSEKKKLERWNKISAESVKQCGRGRIPEVSPVMSVSEVSACAADFDLMIVAYEEETEKTLKQVLRGVKKPMKIGIIIGPEGGFEPEEVQAFMSAGAESVTLGKRILRTETAGHTVLTAVMYELGELE